jgi:hypothetical protein
MKNHLFILVVLLPANLFSQFCGIVVEQKTGDSIPYANIWIENCNIGTTSDLNGKFSFQDSIGKRAIIISAIGFETQRIIPEYNNVRIEMVSKTYEMGEVVVRPGKNHTEFVTGKYNKSSVDLYFSCQNEPWIVARYFEYMPVYQYTPYVSRLKIMVNSKIDNATFNLRLFNIGDDGAPSTDILKENLILTARKGKRDQIVDLSEYHILFPEKGFFVAVEWLILDNNKRDFVYTSKPDGKTVKTLRHEPSFGLVESKRINKCWTLIGGVWKNDWFKNTEGSDEMADLAIELTLTD